MYGWHRCYCCGEKQGRSGRSFWQLTADGDREGWEGRREGRRDGEREGGREGSGGKRKDEGRIGSEFRT